MTHPLDATDRSAAMQSIRLGGQGAQVPPLGLGCMRMSGPPATRDDTEAIATIRASLDAGVGFLDTGDHYGHGHNESLVGAGQAGLARPDGGGCTGRGCRSLECGCTMTSATVRA
jgi:Aldo/keto reductase family